MSGENPTTNPWRIEATLPGLLSGAGYRTALSGKWHLGEAEGSRPHEVGFDEYYGILSVISDMYKLLDERLYPDNGFQPWRGGKGTTWEGGVRVPGIAYWRGMIASGRESDGLFDLTDFFNTSLALAGASGSIPSERYIDGIDQSSFILADDG
nr:sulfatase-like hydrolase/transferase [Paracoccus ravus]